jgi:hypothetical protein
MKVQMRFEIRLMLPSAGDSGYKLFLCPCLRVSALLLRPYTSICVTCHLNLTIQLCNNSTDLKDDRAMFTLKAYLF